MTNKYVFSGHESFPCKSLWLKKGYDFMVHGYNFISPDSVIKLGVGKNMVASIRYWLRAFTLTKNDELTLLANYIFDDKRGVDPYLEDLGTLWLLHFMIVTGGEATLYNWFFMRLQKERKEFTRLQVVNMVKRNMVESGKAKAYNENTVKKDVAVLLQNYVEPAKARSFEDYTSLLLDLNLVRTPDEGKSYQFNIEGKRKLPLEIFLFAVNKWRGDNLSIDFSSLQELSLVFCLSDLEAISLLQQASRTYPKLMHYSDVAGVRQLQFLKNVESQVFLDKYYRYEEN
ncbi:MAG: DUF4007 family protein [Prevotella sp.]|jgi:hypothetical protein